MKKILYFFIILFIFCSCKKDSKPFSSEGSQMVSGVLFWYDPAVDGTCLYYQIENGEQLILKEDTLTMYDLHVKYKDFIGIYSRLTYTDTGDSSCLSGMIAGPCLHPLRVVAVQKLEKQ
jgi:hypothetical protein